MSTSSRVPRYISHDFSYSSTTLVPFGLQLLSHLKLQEITSLKSLTQSSAFHPPRGFHSFDLDLLSMAVQSKMLRLARPVAANVRRQMLAQAQVPKYSFHLNRSHD